MQSGSRATLQVRYDKLRFLLISPREIFKGFELRSFLGVQIPEKVQWMVEEIEFAPPTTYKKKMKPCALSRECLEFPVEPVSWRISKAETTGYVAADA